MQIKDAIGEALETIRTQKLKSFFSLIGVLIGVTFLIAVVSIVQGMNVYMEDRFANKLVGLNTFQLRRMPNFSMGNISEETWREWARRPRINYAEARYIEGKMATPAIYSRYCSQNLPVSWAGKTANGVDIWTADAPMFQIKHLDLEAGRVFTPQEARLGQAVAVIGWEVGDKLFKGADPLGKSITIEGLPYRVVGLVSKQGTLFGFSLDKFVVVPFDSPVHRVACSLGFMDELHIQTENLASMQVALTEVEELMRMQRRLRPAQENNFAMQTAEGALEGWKKISAILMVALPMLVAISLVVGGIVIMNIMLMAVAERTREIGIRKALGAKRRDILAQFVVESATLSTVGAAIGIATGIGLAFLVRATTPLPAAVAPWSILLGVAIGVGVGMVAGVYPATRAAKLDPIRALSQE
ncbi:MAG TPA: ABC transporter permease [Gemmatimonadales bacterium]|jgi:putative ABC transport system permease protein|nr:ABC transporter permease [Gemmatimonadales bacterium]